jgi:thiol-disulfide isomerase/thioredoxin
MYQKSFFIALLAVISVGLIVTASGYFSTWSGNAPSKYDTGLTIEQATKQSNKPLLIEFYSDDCGTCRQLTPLIHNVQAKYKDNATFVMVDVYDKKNAMFVELFKIDVIPSLYVFDAKHMQKIEIPGKYLYTETDIAGGIDRSLKQLDTCIANKNALTVCRQ